MLWKNKINYRFLSTLLFFLLVGIFCFTAVYAADTVNPISGLRRAVAGTGLDRSTSLPSFVGNVIKTVLAGIGVLFLVLTIYAGVMWMLARGDETKIKSARNIIITALTGFIIVMLSYGITSFVVNIFKFR